MAKMYGKGKTTIESEDQQKLRWQVELEFVQCLANPNYLNFLAQRGYFKDQAFINYLKYLQYWKEPEYAKYLMYPMCLYFLDLLQYEHFRREIVNSQCCKFIDDQAILQWQHYTRKRIKMFNSVNGMGQMNAADPAAMDPQQQLQQQQQNAQQNQQQQQGQQQPGGVNAPMGLQNGMVNNAQLQMQQQQQQQQQQQPPPQAQQQQQQQSVGNAAMGMPNGNNASTNSNN
ncbi:PREDICTED: mediator of RNA polymerase II transcription subunit 31-A isoform X1 [Rhagoletis zephyria]|uniref:mediator of RNA polymerase II transcription subunit 31-A isoform X1 n=1 Tax=Rhagoletis zephyria TaxID=28612 RepID=UPI0008118E72|nr:PREDICTED: mediator of RNA polymerase II transcription subunit 31-A isoform X1 [Rhagoletis zephyria]XP_017463237.1 PREDICTED: mediator of RNA polymerase II transcription subunit 31-A isoform X1 [Rhagoletis zephyria]XP_017463242.1 PREDICTED: mediator of RNA polymerase II transcription subunit 31-A isoform X1 [Rhagoletis zephyria]XP_017463248.1 PREDICTED: mediator of RNA polymerase II transcription subunit 31-A isoform X1 [Rhagoletis zephyria]XP_017463255.1 PREDICTED: mediator of RNA polymeras